MGRRVFFDTQQIVLNNGTATSSTSVNVSGLVPQKAEGFGVDFNYAQVTADAGTNLIFTVKWEHKSGSLYVQRNFNLNTPAASQPFALPVELVHFPCNANNSPPQKFFYFTTITAGSSPFLNGYLIYYDSPVGG